MLELYLSLQFDSSLSSVEHMFNMEPMLQTNEYCYRTCSINMNPFFDAPMVKDLLPQEVYEGWVCQSDMNILFDACLTKKKPKNRPNLVSLPCSTLI